MELIKETVSVEDIVCAEQTQLMVDGDIIVPDVKPDILKILQVDAETVVTEKEIADGRLAIAGIVNLKILYIPDKKNECVKSINTSFDFAHKIERGAIMSGMAASVDADAARVEFRLINSRKLSVKTIVGLEMTVCTSKELELVTGIAEENTQLMKVPLKLAADAANCERELVLKDSVEIPAGKVSIGEILKIDTKISDKDMKAVTGKAVVKGVVNTTILYIGDNSEIEFAEMDIPFTEVFDVPNLSESSECEIDYEIRDLYFETAEDNDGDVRVVNLEFVIGAKIKATDHVEIEIVDDCYMPGMETQLERENVSIDEVVCRQASQNTIREIVSLSDNVPEIAEVYHVVTKANVTNTAVENGKILVEGNIDAYILYLCESPESPVYSYRKEIPFSYSLDGAGSKQGMECDVKAEVEHTSYSLNMANEVELRIILTIGAKVIKKRDLALIQDVTVSDMPQGSKKGIIIYFVQNGDRIWDIAKRYRASINDILECNDMSADDKLTAGMQLIIPTGK